MSAFPSGLGLFDAARLVLPGARAAEPVLGDKETIVELDNVSLLSLTFNGGKWLAVGPDGGVVATFGYDGKVYVVGKAPSRLVGGSSWEVLATLEHADELYSQPAIAFGARGTVAVAYVRTVGGPPGRTVCAVAVIESALTSPLVSEWLLSTGAAADGVAYPAIASDEEGGFHVVWPVKSTEAHTHIDYAYLEPGGLGWVSAAVSTNTSLVMEAVVPTVAASVAAEQVVVAWKRRTAAAGAANSRNDVYWTASAFPAAGFPTGTWRRPRLLAGGADVDTFVYDPSLTVTPGGRFFLACHKGVSDAFVVEGDDPYTFRFSPVARNQFAPGEGYQNRFFHLVANDDHVYNVWPAVGFEAPWLIGVYWARAEVESGPTTSPWEELGELPDTDASLVFESAIIGPSTIAELREEQTGTMNQDRDRIEGWSGAEAAASLASDLGISVDELLVGKQVVVPEDIVVETKGGTETIYVRGRYAILGTEAAGTSLSVVRGDAELLPESLPEKGQQVAFSLYDFTMCMQPSVGLGAEGDVHLCWLETSAEMGDWDELQPTGVLCYRKVVTS